MEILNSRDDLEVVLWPEDRQAPREWLLENIKGSVAVIINSSEKVDAEFFDATGPELKTVSTVSVGFEHISKPIAASRSIRIGYTPSVLTDAVADTTILLLLLASRNGGPCVSLVQSGQWPQFNWSPFAFTGPQLSLSPACPFGSPTRTVGFIGFGRIAQAVLARLAGFGITHCLFTSNPNSKPRSDIEIDLQAKHRLLMVKHSDLDEIARESDFVIILAPGGADTHHIINESFLRKMKKTSILVNAARGTLVDSDALAKALKERWIFAAGLDVVEGEPNIGADHPLVKEEKCVILPHIGSATTEARVGMTVTAVRNALAVLDGGEMPAELSLE